MGKSLHSSRATVVAALLLSIAAAGSAHAVIVNIADWNMGNLPNSPAESSNLGTIFGHIGALAGGRPLDLLAMEETDTTSAVTTATVAQSTFGASYASLVSTADGGGDRTGFIYNTATLSVLSTVELNGGDLTHHILRTHFQPVGGNAGSDFYIYSTHLTSGATSAIRANRALEAQQLRADADSLGTANVMFVGDFNWQSAAERGAAGASAYEVFSAPGEGSVSDAVNAVGSWHGNPDFIALHTNDPGASMDDRFDMQLISDELRDGAGLDYVPGSYHVVGNNGTHVLNGDIRSGTGAPGNVLDALYNFDDHLPVLASYSFLVPEPTTLLVAAAFGAMSGSRRRRTA